VAASLPLHAAAALDDEWSAEEQPERHGVVEAPGDGAGVEEAAEGARALDAEAGALERDNGTEATATTAQDGTGAAPTTQAVWLPRPLVPQRLPTWDNAVTLDRGCIQVQLARRGLDDAALGGWCQWARGALPGLGGAGRSSDRGAPVPRPARLPLALDFSGNVISDEGVAQLVKLLTRELRSVRVRLLKLHKNRLGPGAVEPLRQLVRVLGSRPREFCAAPEELHLSHNRLGLEGILALLDTVADAGAGTRLPTYPLQLAAGRVRRPLWLRVEYNGQPVQSPDDFVREASLRLSKIRRDNGWLPVGSRAPMLCLGFYGGFAGCNARRCQQQRCDEGPIAHLSCWGGTGPGPFLGDPAGRANSSRPPCRH